MPCSSAVGAGRRDGPATARTTGPRRRERPHQPILGGGVAPRVRTPLPSGSRRTSSPVRYSTDQVRRTRWPPRARRAGPAAGRDLRQLHRAVGGAHRQRPAQRRVEGGQEPAAVGRGHAQRAGGEQLLARAADRATGTSSSPPSGTRPAGRPATPESSAAPCGGLPSSRTASTGMRRRRPVDHRLHPQVAVAVPAHVHRERAGLVRHPHTRRRPRSRGSRPRRPPAAGPATARGRTPRAAPARPGRSRSNPGCPRPPGGPGTARAVRRRARDRARVVVVLAAPATSRPYGPTAPRSRHDRAQAHRCFWNGRAPHREPPRPRTAVRRDARRCLPARRPPRSAIASSQPARARPAAGRAVEGRRAVIRTAATCLQSTPTGQLHSPHHGGPPGRTLRRG